MGKLSRAKKCMIPFLGGHHILMIFLALSVVVAAIICAGSDSNSIAHRVYLLELSYQNHGTKIPGGWENITLPFSYALRDRHLLVRIGYFGLCVTQGNGRWSCATDHSGLARIYQAEDPLGVIAMGMELKDNVFYPGFLLGSAGLAFLIILLLATWPGRDEELDLEDGSDVVVTASYSRAVTTSSWFLSALATIFAFASALWQHTSSVTAATILESSTLGAVEAAIGIVSTGLSWLVFLLCTIACIGIGILVLSIHVVDRLAE